MVIPTKVDTSQVSQQNANYVNSEDPDKQTSPSEDSFAPSIVITKNTCFSGCKVY